MNIPEGYEGELWRVFTTPSSYQMWKPYNLGMPRWINLGEVFFSTEWAADEYCLLNRPCLSIKDVTEAYSSGRSFVGTDFLINNLKEIAKSETPNP